MVRYGEAPKATLQGQQSRLPETEWHRLSRQPRAIPQKPSLDWLVISFLGEHDIKARPPGQPHLNSLETGRDGRLGNALMGGALGAMGGPLAVGIGAHLGQQKKAIKKQEEIARQTFMMQEHHAKSAKWKSWKQCALSHSDWPAFKDEVMFDWEERVEAAEKHNEMFYEWLDSPEGRQEEQAALAKCGDERSLTRTRQGLKFLSELAVIYFVFLAFVISSGGFVLALQIFGVTIVVGSLILILIAWRDLN